MLVELRIRDFAILESLSLPFTGGLNVLTGETGAGKSIIVGALSLLVGERAHADLIRTGADRATVEGEFDLTGRSDLLSRFDERGIDVEGGIVVLKREIGASRSRAWANGTPITAAVLAELCRALVNIHGQHEAQQLLDPGAQRRILDASADALPLADRVRSAWERVQALDAALRSRERARTAARQREDWLRHVVGELSVANLRVGEDAELAAELRTLAHAVELRQGATEAAAALDGDGDDVAARLAAVRRTLDALQRLDPALEPAVAALEASLYQVRDVARELAAYAERAESNPERLAEVERRRDLIFSVTRKYGGTEESALVQLAAAERELALLDDPAAGSLGAGAEELERARAEFVAAASALSAARGRGAEELVRDVQPFLETLGLADGRFGVDLRALPAPGPDGAEEVEFTAALNVGHPARPLARIASGGELSRLMLAIKTVLARHDAVPTLVFDEVDAGIGGAVALQVGDAMRRVASHHQVFAVTHLAQIAARADHHIVVSKGARGGITTADVRVVAADDRVEELARMLGGDPASPVSRQHARELLGAAGPTAQRAGATPAPRAARTPGTKSGRR